MARDLTIHDVLGGSFETNCGSLSRIILAAAPPPPMR